MDKVMTWIKANILLALGIALAAIFIFFPKILRGSTRRVKHGPSWYLQRGKPLPQRLIGKSGKPIPRSVGIRRANTQRASGGSSGGSAKGYAAVGGGTIPFKYNKDGSVKKAWQVAGTLAAKQRMSRLRKNR